MMDAWRFRQDVIGYVGRVDQPRHVYDKARAYLNSVSASSQSLQLSLSNPSFLGLSINPICRRFQRRV